jgi:hypothetical protein
MKDETKLQPDLFDDEFDAPRVFRCIAGAYIGTFNRQAVAGGEGADAVRRLSDFLPSEQAAYVALAAGTWPAPEPEAP